MKHLLITAIVFCFCNHSFAQNNLFITSVKLGNIKINDPLDVVNEYLDIKVEVKMNVNDESYYGFDTVYTKYKSQTVRLVFNQSKNYETNKVEVKLFAIYSANKSITTKSGITIGQNKFDIIKKLDGSYLHIYPNTELGKNNSVVSLMDVDNGTNLIFYFNNNILYAIEASLVEDAC